MQGPGLHDPPCRRAPLGSLHNARVSVTVCCNVIASTAGVCNLSGGCALSSCLLVRWCFGSQGSCHNPPTPNDWH